MNSIQWNGVDTSVYKVYVDGSLSHDVPAKITDSIAIPGRNGNFIIDYGTYKNISVVYPCYMKGNFSSDYRELITRLSWPNTYMPLYYSGDPSHYRIARFLSGSAPTVKNFGRDGYFNLTFDCKPQRFYVSGDEETIYTADATLIPVEVSMVSRPLINVYGAGTFTIKSRTPVDEDTTITVSAFTPPVGYPNRLTIDCERMECYFATSYDLPNENVSANEYVTFLPNRYPVLAGTNYLELGTATRVGIIPKWWEL